MMFFLPYEENLDLQKAENIRESLHKIYKNR